MRDQVEGSRVWSVIASGRLGRAALRTGGRYAASAALSVVLAFLAAPFGESCHLVVLACAGVLGLASLAFVAEGVRQLSSAEAQLWSLRTHEVLHGRPEHVPRTVRLRWGPQGWWAEVEAFN